MSFAARPVTRTGTALAKAKDGFGSLCTSKASSEEPRLTAGPEADPAAAERQFSTYLFSYPYRGAWWTLSVKAESAEDAQKRVDALSDYGKYDGELMMTVPYELGWFVKLLVWWRNRR